MYICICICVYLWMCERVYMSVSLFIYMGRERKRERDSGFVCGEAAGYITQWSDTISVFYSPSRLGCYIIVLVQVVYGVLLRPRITSDMGAVVKHLLVPLPYTGRRFIHHLFSSCSKSLTDGRYFWCHDRVLGAVARVNDTAIKSTRSGRNLPAFSKAKRRTSCLIKSIFWQVTEIGIFPDYIMQWWIPTRGLDCVGRQAKKLFASAQWGHWNIVWRTCCEWWMIGTERERRIKKICTISLTWW